VFVIALNKSFLPLVSVFINLFVFFFFLQVFWLCGFVTFYPCPCHNFLQFFFKIFCLYAVCDLLLCVKTEQVGLMHIDSLVGFHCSQNPNCYSRLRVFTLSPSSLSKNSSSQSQRADQSRRSFQQREADEQTAST
jgi:hypothetical protein